VPGVLEFLCSRGFSFMATIPFPELLKLGPAERIQLAQDSWDSIAEEEDALPLTDGHRAELDRRMAEHERDPSSAVPWSEVRARLRERFGV
jgi:putative addiction module component (TIGR02574 family)